MRRPLLNTNTLRNRLYRQRGLAARLPWHGSGPGLLWGSQHRHGCVLTPGPCPEPESLPSATGI